MEWRNQRGWLKQFGCAFHIYIYIFSMQSFFFRNLFASSSIWPINTGKFINWSLSHGITSTLPPTTTHSVSSTISPVNYRFFCSGYSLISVTLLNEEDDMGGVFSDAQSKQGCYGRGRSSQPKGSRLEKKESIKQKYRFIPDNFSSLEQACIILLG